jgi:hypothetical protein
VAALCFKRVALRLFEIVRVLLRFDHVALAARSCIRPSWLCRKNESLPVVNMLLGINPNETVESVEAAAVVISSAPQPRSLATMAAGLSPEPNVKQLTRLPLGSSSVLSAARPP